MRRATVLRGGNRRPSVDLLDTQSPLKRFLRRNLVGLGGLSIIALAAALAASLATWSVHDPSLNHATSGAVKNALGYPGAVLSDILMQSIGLATAVFLVPIVLWGWRLLTGNMLRIRRKRITFWLIGTSLAAGALAALPIPESWPLPSGLGGFIGDAVQSVPALLTTNLTSGAAMFLGVMVLGIPAIFFLINAAGWIGSLEDERTPAPARMPTGHGVADDLDDYDDEPESRVSLLLSSTLGYAGHTALQTGALLRRMFGKKRRPAETDDWDTEEEEEIYEEDYEDERPAGGRFMAFRRALAKRLMPDEDDGLADYYDPADEQAAEIAHYGHAYQAADDDAYPVTEEGESFSPNELMIDKGRVYGAQQDPAPSQANQAFIAQAPADQAPVHQGPVGIAAPHGHADTPDVAQQASRVVPPAPRPKEGKRALEEAQASLLGAPEFYEFPPLHLLSEAQESGRVPGLSADALEQNARILEGVLEDFGVRGEIIEVRPGPVVTLYELEPAPGIKSSRVIGLADDIARSMSAISARVAVIPGKNAIGIELPNARRETVYLRELLAAQDFEKSKSKLPLALGKTINGESVVADLARMPHLLVAGTTGSGKSVSINTMILSLLYRLNPDDCKLIMIDPKMLELSIYDGIPHLLTPVVTDPKKAVVALKWTVREMEERYKKMSKMGVRNIDGYNTRIKQVLEKGESFTRTVQTGFDRDTGQPVYEEEELPLEKMPYIVVVVDEMADLMMVAGKDIEGAIQRLAQMARAAGIHLIMATQRPSVDVITGTIKANFPTRISFQVTSKIDSRTILGEMGAEQLLGMGDMLFMAGGGRIQRVHGPFVSDGEVEDIVSHLKVQGTPQYLEAVTEEDEDAASPYDGGGASGGSGDGNDLYDQAVAIVLRDKKASTSYIQRRLSIGYNRAASLIERMEQEGLISAANHAGKREILVENGVEEPF